LKTIWENTIGKEKNKGRKGKKIALLEIVRVKTQFNQNYKEEQNKMRCIMMKYMFKIV
jgi:hypothetical protein